MPFGGSITQEERQQRMIEVKKLLDEGYSENQIAEELGMALSTVRNNKRYLKQLETADLSPEIIAEKRSEIYLELLEATDLAKGQFQSLKEMDKHTQARGYFNLWLDALKMRADLYGLTDNKINVNTQINNINEYEYKDKLPSQQAEIIRKSLIEAHERKVRNG